MENIFIILLNFYRFKEIMWIYLYFIIKIISKNLSVLDSIYHLSIYLPTYLSTWIYIRMSLPFKLKWPFFPSAS